MATKTVMTDKGMELLANTSNVMGGEYWLGYCSFAYVPQDWKASIDPIFPGMTQLTKYGDTIYNIFQGDLLNKGYSGSAHGYNTNIKTHYNYTVENNVNKLVLWKRNSEYNPDIPASISNREFFGYHVYNGTSGGSDPVNNLSERSSLPIPAPLFYMGDVVGQGGNTSSLINLLIDDSEFLPRVELNAPSPSVYDAPRVSIDIRSYEPVDGLSNPTLANQLDSTANPLPIIGSTQRDVWYGADSTRLSGSNPDLYIDELYEFVTISNYNRYHTPLIEYGSDADWRSAVKSNNMSKMTKYFPIESFDVLSSSRGVDSTGSSRSIATGIKTILSVNIAPTSRDVGYDSDGVYQSFDVKDARSRYGQPSESSDLELDDIIDNALYNIRTSSFQFNRIGVYAVKTRKNIVQSDSTELGDATRGDDRVFFEIDPDTEPVLFAVCDWDSTSKIDETGDPSAQYTSEISLNLSAFDDGVGESSLIRDTSVFHNLYENDSIKYYKNQLVSNAQISHAVTKQGFEISNIMNMIRNQGTSCSTSSTSVSNVSGMTNVGGGIGVYKGTTSVGNTFRSVRSGDGKILVKEGSDGSILISAGKSVYSSATTVSGDLTKSPLAVYNPNSLTDITSAVNQATLSGGVLELSSTKTNYEKYTSAGLAVGGKWITSNGLIETIISSLTFSAGLYGDGSTINIPLTDIDSIGESGVNDGDLIRSIHWVFTAPANGYTLTMDDDNSTITSVVKNGQSAGNMNVPFVLNDLNTSIIFESIADLGGTIYIVSERASSI